MTFYCLVIHHYSVHKRGVPHVTFRRNYMSQLRALLPLPAVPLTEERSPDPVSSSVGDSPDVVSDSSRPSRRTFARQRLTRIRETPRRIAPRLTEQDTLAAAGSMVFDCRPQVLPGAIDVSGTELAEIRSMNRAGVATAAPPKREQSWGGDLLSLICPELGVAPLVDPGTDYEDELPTPAGPPAVVDQEMDSELQKVFIDVVSLPTMVTPVSDMDGTLRMPQAECPVVAPPAVPAFVNRPSLTPSSAGPKLLSPILFSPPPASVGVSPVPRTSPLVAVPEDLMLFNAAVTNQTQPESSPSLMGSMAGGRLPAIPLTPSHATALAPRWSWVWLGNRLRWRIGLERGRLTFIRIIRVPFPLHGYCKTPRGVCFK